MAAVPDIASFWEAQSRLRNQLGTDATFHVVGDPVYPPGTQLDAETGRPFDPAIRPTSQPVTDKTHKVSVYQQPPNTRIGTAREGWSGLRRGDIVVLMMDVDVYTDVQDATEVTIKGTDFQIQEVHEDPGIDNRYVMQVEMK